MKLKRRYLAVIVALMVVMTALVASVVVSSVQGSRIAYVAVSADKENYSAGENVTFQLRPLTEGVDFTVGGTVHGPSGYQYSDSVNVIRIPDSVEPYSAVDNSSRLNDIGMWNSQYSASIPIPRFSSSGDPLSLSWNGTVLVHDYATGAPIWAQASAGYYILYPLLNVYPSTGDHNVKFYLDRSSIFYYDGLRVDYQTARDGPDAIFSMNLTLPPGAPAATGNLTAYVSPYSSGPVPAAGPTSPFHNFTVDLRPGEASTVTMRTGTDSYFDLDVLLSTDHGVYAFGFQHRTAYYSNGGTVDVIVGY